MYSTFGLVQGLCPPAFAQESSWPQRGIIGLEPGFLLSQLIILPITLSAAYLVTKYIDEPVARYLHYIFHKLAVRYKKKLY
jgi:hypothetical protein